MSVFAPAFMTYKQNGPSESVKNIVEKQPGIWLASDLGQSLVLLEKSLVLEDMATRLLTPREASEGRTRLARSAYSDWLFGRLAAKLAGAELWGIAEQRIEILRDASGRPQAFLPGGQKGSVSVSHTVCAAAALASVAGRSPGIDLERADRVISDRSWKWAFTEDERALTDENRGQLPSRLAMWCAKEAAGKAWGLALLNHLQQIRITGADWPASIITVAWLGERPVELQVRATCHGPYLLLTSSG